MVSVRVPKAVVRAVLCMGMLMTLFAAGPAYAAEALVPGPLPRNDVAPNPYMSASEGSVHNDCYSSDVTDAVLPLDIDSEVGLATEPLGIYAPSAAFYDEYGNAITPLLGGISIAQMDGDVIERSGAFVPAQHDGGGYSVQISYSFVDADNNVVMPTTDGRIICVRTLDADGQVLPVFEKVFDIDVLGPARAALGEDIDPNLLSIVYDYEGNLWFTTGGFRIYPDRNPAGFVGYISRAYIDAVVGGTGELPAGGIQFMRLAEGEGAENGISACEQGAVVLTNAACYLLRAGEGVDTVWCVPYESAGANDAVAGSGYTGGGLSYGSGTTPTLTRDLVLFTDNLDPVNLVAVSIETGEVVATAPVFASLDATVPVAIENSILVYDAGLGTTSVILANWFGAGNAGLADPDANSSIQSYDNIYDAQWRAVGNDQIAPGLERIDIVHDDAGDYTAVTRWTRADVCSTAMVKLSTATGYLYGYWQDAEGTWCYTVLDFDTGETLVEKPVSALPGYNNVAVGMIPDPAGTILYCPTNTLEMARWQDDYVYLPEIPVKDVAARDMSRTHLTDDEFLAESGEGLPVRSYLMGAAVPHALGGDVLVAFKLNGLEGAAGDMRLFARDAASGALVEYEGPWELVDAEGAVVSAGASLVPTQLYELRLRVEDNGGFDLDGGEGAFAIEAVLAG